MRRRVIFVLLVFLCLPVVSGVAAAQSQPRVGTTVVVAEDETVNGFTAYAGTVVIEGTVQGDLTVFATRVVVAEGATVTGRVRAFAGSVEIAGTIGQNAVTYAGETRVTESGQISGTFGAFGGPVVLAGHLQRDVTTISPTVTLAPTATVNGLLIYTAGYSDHGGTITIEARHVSELALFPPLTGPAKFIFTLYLMVAEFLTGALILYFFPQFTRHAVRTTSTDPIQVGTYGFAALLAIPLLIILTFITIIGIPLALATSLAYLILLWLGGIIGQYLLGTGLLTFTNVTNPYLALGTGIVAMALLALIPYLGPLLRISITALGVGILTLGILATYRTIHTTNPTLD